MRISFEIRICKIRQKGRKAMRKAFNLFDKALKVLLTTMAIAMIVIGFMQVFFRFVVKSPLTWSEELIRYIFVWTTFLGVPIGVARNGHASFDILEKRVPEKYQRGYQTMLLVLAGIMFTALVILGVPFAQKNMSQLTPAMHIPYTCVIAAVPTGGAVGVLYVVHSICELYRKKDQEKGER